MTRRKAIGIGAATLASTTLTKLLGGPAEAAAAASAAGTAPAASATSPASG